MLTVVGKMSRNTAGCSGLLVEIFIIFHITVNRPNADRYTFYVLSVWIHDIIAVAEHSVIQSRV